jgi:hypothetical protein
MGAAGHPFGVDPVTREIDEVAAELRRTHGHITKLQSRQLAWLKRWSRTERDERLRAYYLECHECGVVEVQHVASVMAQVVFKHAGHHTWLRMSRGSPYRIGGR